MRGGSFSAEGRQGCFQSMASSSTSVYGQAVMIETTDCRWKPSEGAGLVGTNTKNIQYKRTLENMHSRIGQAVNLSRDSCSSTP